MKTNFDDTENEALSIARVSKSLWVFKTKRIMKNYLAFFGSVYYPSGGMDDFLNDFDTLEEAIEAIKQKNIEYNQGDWSYAWANVYSLQDRMEVYTT